MRDRYYWEAVFDGSLTFPCLIPEALTFFQRCLCRKWPWKIETISLHGAKVCLLPNIIKIMTLSKAEGSGWFAERTLQKLMQFP